MGKLLILCAFVLAACHHKHADTTEPPPEQIKGDSPQFADTSANMVPPQQAEEVSRALGRKRNIVSHCLATAVDNKELPKNSHGKMALEIIFAPGGTVQSVKIISSTLESKTLSECVVARIKDLQVPSITKRYETSYTYAFEAM